MSLLELKNINTGYENKQVLYNVNLSIEKNKTVLLIGSNGSGKTTLFKVIYGILPTWQKQGNGEIFFNGENITFTRSQDLIKKGLMYIPQTNELFENMTVEQNIEMSLLHLNNKKESKERIKSVFSKIEFLENKKKQIVSSLSGGERKLVTLGMVVVNRPKLVLYDEPLAGLNGNSIITVLKCLELMKQNGTTLFIIEHRIKEFFSIADRIIGLKLGRMNKEDLKNLDNIKSFII